jgi:hypothetical protein
MFVKLETGLGVPHYSYVIHFLLKIDSNKFCRLFFLIKQYIVERMYS